MESSDRSDEGSCRIVRSTKRSSDEKILKAKFGRNSQDSTARHTCHDCAASDSKTRGSGSRALGHTHATLTDGCTLLACCAEAAHTDAHTTQLLTHCCARPTSRVSAPEPLRGRLHLCRRFRLAVSPNATAVSLILLRLFTASSPERLRRRAPAWPRHPCRRRGWQ